MRKQDKTAVIAIVGLLSIAFVAVLASEFDIRGTRSMHSDIAVLRSDVFYLGMPSDEALSKLPPGYKLMPLLVFYDYGPGGPTSAEWARDEYFGIANYEQTESVPLFFNQEKRLVRVGVRFDEKRFVSLWRKRTSHAEKPK